MSAFYATFARKMPELYTIIARKIFFQIPFFGGGRGEDGGHALPIPPVSYAYAVYVLTRLLLQPLRVVHVDVLMPSV